jgi:hypothetical protein
MSEETERIIWISICAVTLVICVIIASETEIKKACIEKTGTVNCGGK